MNFYIFIYIHFLSNSEIQNMHILKFLYNFIRTIKEKKWFQHFYIKNYIFLKRQNSSLWSRCEFLTTITITVISFVMCLKFGNIKSKLRIIIKLLLLLSLVQSCYYYYYQFIGICVMKMYIIFIKTYYAK